MNIISEKIMPELKWLDKHNPTEPCYLFDSVRFIENYNLLRNALYSEFGNKYLISYSCKTNSAGCVLQRAIEAGALMEIVSKHEYEMVLAQGATPERIVYNGVIPDAEGKFAVANKGGIVNIENGIEFQELAELAYFHHKPISVGLRINIDIGTGHSRFGVTPFTEEWKWIMKTVSKNPYIKLRGIHCHISNGREIEFWERRARLIGEIAKQIDAEYIDFGSNMYGPMDERLKKQFGANIPSFQEYVSAIGNELRKVYGESELPLIIVEPGTPLVGNTVSLAAKVVAIRKNGMKMTATVDISKYDLYFLVLTKKIPIDIIPVVFSDKSERIVPDMIYGYTCVENDIVSDSIEFPIGIGDRLLFRNVGAYCGTMASNFIKLSFDTVDIWEQKF